jgi:hypothetical protein
MCLDGSPIGAFFFEGLGVGIGTFPEFFFDSGLRFFELFLGIPAFLADEVDAGVGFILYFNYSARKQKTVALIRSL